jgi:hypothetical protein
MISIPRVRKAIDDSTHDDAPEHEWAEYNLPSAFLPGPESGDEDQLAFVGIATEGDDELPERAS